MTYLHCQVRFKDFATWKASMKADTATQQAAGLHLKHLWRGLEDTDIAFFIMEVEDIEKAKKFLDPVEIAQAAKAAGAADFEWFLVEEV